MRAYLIMPEHSSIEEVHYNGELKDIYDLFKCRSITEGSRPLRGSISTGFDGLFVSDDNLAERDERFWFQVDANREPPSSFPIAGRGLVTGTDPDGEPCDAQISLSELTERITFTRRKFRGFTTGTQDGVFVVGVQAPIIDDGAP